MEQEALQQMVAENREWEAQLTKRNEQYLFDLKKALTAANLTEEEKAVAVHELLTELLPAQKKGQTARQLFGTVSEKTTAILNKPAAKPVSKQWQMWIDDSLLLFSVLAIASGGMAFFFTKKPIPAPYNGLLSLLVIAFAGGFIFTLMYKYFYQYSAPGADRSKRPKLIVSIGITGLGFIGWFLLIYITAIIPAPFNIPLDSFSTLVLGLGAFALRYWLKKKYNFRGSIMSPNR